MVSKNILQFLAYFVLGVLGYFLLMPLLVFACFVVGDKFHLLMIDLDSYHPKLDSLIKFVLDLFTGKITIYLIFISLLASAYFLSNSRIKLKRRVVLSAILAAFGACTFLLRHLCTVFFNLPRETFEASSLDENEKSRLGIDLSDGISREEATAIASYFLFDRQKVHCGSVGEATDAKTDWLFDVAGGYEASPDGYLLVDKKTGDVSRYE